MLIASEKKCQFSNTPEIKKVKFKILNHVKFMTIGNERQR